jgi:hypothetical protein
MISAQPLPSQFHFLHWLIRPSEEEANLLSFFFFFFFFPVAVPILAWWFLFKDLTLLMRRLVKRGWLRS